MQGCDSLPTISWGNANSESSSDIEPSPEVSREDIIAHAAEIKSGEVVKVGNRIMMMGDLYMSASGLKCRQVTILGGGGKQMRLACKKGPDWCLTENIISR